MPVQEKVKLKQRDIKTKVRIEAAKRSANVLSNFFEKGFKSYEALNAIVLHYNPEISEKRLKDFWHFRVVDGEMCDSLEVIFEKLKAE